MGYNSWTTNDLLDDITLRSHMPTGQLTFTSAQLLKLAQFELQTPVTKQILSARGNYYMTYTDYAIVSDGTYAIPSGAIGATLANVELIQNTTIVPVNQIEEAEQFSTISPTSTSYGFILKGNYVQILPTPNVGTARLWYYKRTSNLVLTTACAQVTAINGLVVSVSSLPSTIVNGSYVDECGDQPPFNVYASATVTNVSGTDVTLDSVSDSLAVGDWLALNQQTCIPQIPVEFRLILVQRVVCNIYELQGYLEKLKAAQAKLMEYEKNTLDMISPRVKSQTKVISAVNGGFLAGNGNRLTNFPAGRDT